MSPEPTDWAVFGSLLISRRIEIDSAYRNRRTFSNERGIEYTLAYRIEKGAISRPEAASKAVIEQAYGLVTGSFDRSVAAGRLEIAADTETEPSAAAPEPASPDMAYLRAALPQLEPAHLSVLVGLVRSWIEPIPAAADQRRTA